MLVDFYFDFISPYSYLAVKRMSGLPALSMENIRWLPVNLPKLIKDCGNTPPASCRAKAMYLLRDLKRWAAVLDVPFRMIRPGSFDARPALSLACMLKGAECSHFCTEAFNAIWSGAVDPVHDEEWLARILAVQGLPEEWLKLDQQAGKQVLKENTEKALKAGCFGVPTYILRDKGRAQMYWGIDHMGYLIEDLGKL